MDASVPLCVSHVVARFVANRSARAALRATASSIGKFAAFHGGKQSVKFGARPIRRVEPIATC